MIQRYRFSSILMTKILVLIGLTTLWSVTLAIFEPSWLNNYFQMLFFGFTTSLCSFWFLDALDYFNSFYPLPSPDSLFTLIFVIPVAAMVSKYFLLLTFNLMFLRYRDIVLATPFISLIVYAIQWYSGKQFLSSNRRKICFLTTKEEAEKVLRALRSKLLLKYYQPIFEEDLKTLSSQEELTCVVISRSELYRFEKKEHVLTAMLEGEMIVDHREMIADLRGHVNIDELDLWMFLYQSVHRGTFGRIYYTAKIVLESVVSAVALILLSPLFIFVAIGTKLSSPGPIFFGQKRLGYRGAPFTLWKFRSMRNDAEKMGPRFSRLGDVRITPFGNFLRKTRLDELPQLWNVVRGEMSLIGPRPERPEFYDEFEKTIPIFRFRLLVPPGITGWAQVMGGYAATPAQMKRKLEYDLYYLQKMSPKMDVWIGIKTVAVALRSLFRSSAM